MTPLANRGIAMEREKERQRSLSTAVVTLPALVVGVGFASVVETEDRDGWFGAAGPVTRIGFT